MPRSSPALGLFGQNAVQYVAFFASKQLKLNRLIVRAMGRFLSKWDASDISRQVALAKQKYEVNAF